MELSLSPPAFILYIGLGAFGLVLVTSLRKGSPRSRAIRIGAAALVIGGLLVYLYRPTYIKIDGKGITSNSGGRISISWSEVKSAVYLPDLRTSDYLPTSKIVGVDFGSYQVGTFHTSGGTTARVIAQQDASGLIIQTGEKLYLFAPTAIDRMATEVTRHVTVANWPPGGHS